MMDDERPLLSETVIPRRSQILSIFSLLGGLENTRAMKSKTTTAMTIISCAEIPGDALNTFLRIR
jgi:hypothetical protein